MAADGAGSRGGRRGECACDDCGAPSIAIGHSGDGTPTTVQCTDCFLAAHRAERATRPSRAEMIRRVDDEILTAAEICRVLKIHENTLYRWIASHGFPAFKLGPRKWAVRRSEMDEWLATRRAA